MIRSRQSWGPLSLALGALVICASTATAQTPQLIGGRNVNMTGGSQLISVSPFQVRGDVLGRAQNEPSCAMSTRNPQHILCGANDYRMVDVPGVTTTQLIRDAWLGEFQSIDGGETWESTLAGGFFMDPARHPLRTLGYRAGADAVVRSGPAGLTYYAGIAFTSDKSRSAVHVTTYIDLNNRENDNMPFKPVRTVVPASSSTAARFIDKPWMYVEAAPAGQTCSISVPTPATAPLPTTWSEMITAWLERLGAPGWEPGRPPVQRVPASIVHLVYTVFTDPTDSTAEIMYTRSDNCGQTFSVPVKLSNTPQQAVGLNEHGNGAAVAKPLATGTNRVYAAWRRVRLVTVNGVLPDAIMGVYSNDNGRTWSQPQVISEICPFDQGTTSTSFRHTAFPTMTADGTGRVYIAWSDRRQPDGTCIRTPTGAADGAARIRIATSTNGLTWTQSTAVPSETPEHQIFPTIAFTAGRVVLGWVDFAEDASQVFGQFINEADVLANVPAIRHTGDVRAAIALPGAAPDFGGGPTQISEYLRGKVVTGGQTVLGQIQWNAVNRRWARKGAVPFNGDYIDIGTLPYLPPLPGQTAWRPNNQATIATPLGLLPTVPQVLFAWADNRDMRTGPDVDNPNVPVPYQTPNGLALAPQSAFDPTQDRPICTVGADSFKTGAHNQNTYSARASIGFLAAAPGNNKELGGVTRAFVVYLRNDTTAAKSFRMVVAPPPGGFASFHQFVTSMTVLDVNVPRRSSVARTIYVSRNPQSATPLASGAAVRVDVVEMEGATPVQASTVILNGDASAPEIEAPEIEAREIYTPEIEAPEIEAHTAGAPEIEAPEIEAPEIEAPEIEAAAWKALGLQRPEIEAPEIEALEVEAPEIEAPEIEATAITDIRFTITNTGNTTAQYNAKGFVTPQEGSDFRYQVIVRRRYELPAVDANCEPTTIALSKVAVNLPDVALGTPEIEAPEIEAPEIEAAGVATFYLEPGAKAEITIRARSLTGQTLDPETVDIGVDAPVDSDDAALGITDTETATTYLTVATGVLPAGRINTPYAWDLQASGALGAVVWELVSGALPAGVTLAPSGQLSGTPTVSGTYSFRVRVTDSEPRSAERNLTLVIASGAASLAFVTQPTTTPVGTVITPSVSVRAFTAAGAPAANVTITLSRVDGGPLNGTLVRTTGVTGVAVFDNLVLPAAGAGVVLRATAGGYGFTDSIPFNSGVPDLVVSSIDYTPEPASTSDPVKVTVAVTNGGSGTAGPSIVRLEISEVVETELPVPSLAPGATFLATTWLGPLPEGDWTIVATADAYNVVAELDETNNAYDDDLVVEEGGGGEGSITIDDSPAAFALATDAANATGPLPDYGELVGLVPVGRVAFAAGPDGDYVDIGGPGADPDWYPGLPGHDIALGIESLRVEFESPVTAFGFYFVEPNSTMPMWGGSPVDSDYRVRLFDGETLVGEYLFNAPDDEVAFIGVQHATPFTSALIQDLSGSDDDEYFGEFYVDYGDVLGTFLVTNSDDNGPGSLREAMEAAEAQPGKNQIVFALDGEDNGRIDLDSVLPTVTAGNPVIIDATTAPDFEGAPTIEVRPSAESSAGQAFVIEADDSVIRGFSVTGFPDGGIVIGGSMNKIWGNYVGLRRNGDTLHANGGAGVVVGLGPPALLNQIGSLSPLGRNVFAGSDTGVLLDVGASSNVLVGNYIGTDANGTEARPNVTGVKVWSNAGLNQITGNVISGNSGDGLSVLASNFNVIRSNRIGVAAIALMPPLPNFHGVVFVADEGSSVGNVLGGSAANEGNVIAYHQSANVLVGNLNSTTTIQGNIIGAESGTPLAEHPPQQFGINITGATGTIVGGILPEARNVIVGVDYAIQALGAGVTTIEGNFIGTFDGLTPFGDPGSSGVFVEGGIGVSIGGATAAQGNVIGNVLNAVTIISGNDETTSLPVVANNRIGVGTDGVSPLPAASGIAIVANGNGLVLNAAIESNLLENVGGVAVSVTGDGATQNIIRRNEFRDDSVMAIDLGGDGPTVNDVGDADTGPNNRQNYPVFSAVTATLVSGSISGAPSTEYILDLYTCSAAMKPRSYGTTVNVTTNASGDGFFSLGFAGLTTPMTMMATDELGNSSEFNDCHALDSALVVTNTNDGGAGSLRAAIVAANAAADLTPIIFGIPGFPHTITPATPLPAITQPIFLDATTQAGYDGRPAITLDGSIVGGDGGDGLVLSGGGNTIRGLNIQAFRNGIVIDDSDFNVITANFLGTSRLGDADAGNIRAGIRIEGSDNTIGGPGLDRNVISGNDFAGISFEGVPSTYNIVQGNYIGVGADGTTPIGNGAFDAEAMENVGFGISVPWSSSNLLIGGNPASGHGNTISGNPTGVYVSGSSSVTIRGNSIGMDPTAQASTAPNEYGIVVVDGEPTIEDNTISGNQHEAIIVRATAEESLSGGEIVGNHIGVAVDGTTQFSNGAGILVESLEDEGGGGSVSSLSISFNIIAGNGAEPIRLIGDGTTRISILSNSIYDNSEPLDLGADGPDVNDADDVDDGPNGYQNYPVITHASALTGIIEGTLQSAAFTVFNIQIFASPVCGPHREGRVLLREIFAGTDEGGYLEFSEDVGLVFEVGVGITATATDEDGNTSEFSACYPATGASITSVTPGEGKAGEGFLVLRGTDLPHLVGDVTAVVQSGATTANGFVFISPSSPTAVYVRLPAVPLGVASIQLRNGDETIITNAFPIMVTAVPGTPVIQAILDASAEPLDYPVAPGNTIKVRADGIDTTGAVIRFVQGMDVWDVPAGSASSNPAIGLVVDVVVPGDADIGTVDVSIKQGGSAFSTPVSIEVDPGA